MSKHYVTKKGDGFGIALDSYIAPIKEGEVLASLLYTMLADLDSYLAGDIGKENLAEARKTYKSRILKKREAFEACGFIIMESD